MVATKEDPISVTEAAKRLEVNREVILKACQTGQLPARKLGWQWFIEPSDLPKSWPPRPFGEAKARKLRRKRRK